MPDLCDTTYDVIDTTDGAVSSLVIINNFALECRYSTCLIVLNKDIKGSNKSRLLCKFNAQVLRTSYLNQILFVVHLLVTIKTKQ